MPAKSNTKILGMQWEFSSLWNEALRSLPQRVMQKRSNIWASELGYDYISRYLEMNAHPMSNPPNDRSRRKFTAGHVWEWIIGLVLTLCGILKEKQLRGEVQLPGLLKVSGRLDFIAGGQIDWEKSKSEVKRVQQLFAVSIDDMPPIIFHAVERIMFRMEQMFSRVPLKEVVLECKSVSSFISELIEKTGKPRPGHALQNLHYLLANKMDEGMLLYVNKDDAVLSQFAIHPTKELLKEYKTDVKQMTEYYNAAGKNYLKNLPPLEPQVHFVEGTFNFQKNVHVQYSPYLTFLYNFKDFDEFNETWRKPLGQWNRTFRRCVIGANMTKLNLDTIKEAAKLFPDWDKYVQQAKKAGAFEKPDLEEGE